MPPSHVQLRLGQRLFRVKGGMIVRHVDPEGMRIGRPRIEQRPQRNRRRSSDAPKRTEKQMLRHDVITPFLSFPLKCILHADEEAPPRRGDPEIRIQLIYPLRVVLVEEIPHLQE